MAAQQRYLHDDAVVRQAVYKRVGQSLGNQLFVVVIRLVLDIEYRFVDVAHPVAQQIDSHHGQSMLATVLHVVRVVVLYAQVLSETQCLRFKPGLLKLYQNKLF